MEVDQRQQLRKYIDLVMRRKEIIMFFLMLSIVAGIGVYLKTPKIYASSSLIMFQQQQINLSRMSPDVATRTTEMVNTVGQQVTSRTNLEEIITRYKLYPKELEKLPMEEVVAAMREKHISIKPQRGGDMFTVAFEGSEPKTVMLVANALASKFIEENLRFREEKTSERSAYVKDELTMAKEALDKKEAVLRDYKLQYYNEMASQLPVNMERLNALQTQYQTTQTNIQNLEHTRLLVQEQITIRKDMLNQLEERRASEVERRQAQADAGAAVSTEVRTQEAERQDIRALRMQLEAMQAKYTDQHPDVKRLKRQLAKLKEEQKASSSQTTMPTATVPQQQAAAHPLATQQAQRREVPVVLDQQLEQLERQLKDIGFNITRLNEEKIEIQKQIKTFQRWVDAAPIREAEWAGLTRDYNELRRHYETLVARNLEANSAETLERHQKGSQFKIVDSARLAEKPIRPDFKKIMLLALALGLGIGGGVALALELLDTSFKDAGDVEKALGVPVLCAIPLLESELDKKRKKMHTLLWTSALVVSVLIIGAGMIYLFKKGLIVF